MCCRKYIGTAVPCKAKIAMQDLRFPQPSLLRIHVLNVMLCCWVGVSQRLEGRYSCFHLQGLPGPRGVHCSWTPQFCKLKALHSFKMSENTNPMIQYHMPEDPNSLRLKVLNCKLSGTNKKNWKSHVLTK
jgi:hypothetical protein